MTKPTSPSLSQLGKRRRLEIQHLEARQMLAADLSQYVMPPGGESGVATPTQLGPVNPIANIATPSVSKATNKLTGDGSSIEFRKLGGTLSSFIVTSTNNPLASTIADAYSETRKLVHINKSQQILVDAFSTTNGDQLSTEIKGLGGVVTGVAGKGVSAWVPITQLGSLARLPSLGNARASMMETHVGRTTSQGDRALGANTARTDFKVDGKGIAVGVLSDSFDNDNDLTSVNIDYISQDLPDSFVNVLLEGPDGSSDEGRAMLQLVHDLAPGSDLLFHSAVYGEAAFAQGIRALRAAGADVIVDDIGYFAAPMFQDGIVAQAVDAVTAQGASYFSAAGNNDNNSWEDAGGYRSMTQDGLDLHDFDPGPGQDPYQEITVPIGTQIIFSFQWNQPYASAGGRGATGDLNIFITNILGGGAVFVDPLNFIAAGLDFNVGADPTEVFAFFNDGSFDLDGVAGPDTKFNLFISHVEGDAPSFLKYVYTVVGNDPTIEYNTNSSTVYGHANASTAISVGAAFYQQTPAFGRNPAVLESFSSIGGIEIRFDRAGNALKTFESRVSPDITAPDGTNTTFFGTDVDGDRFPNFFGTSAAAPHAAAIAALMLQAAGGENSLTPARIATVMTSSVFEMGKPGFEYTSGFGYLDGYTAVNTVSKLTSVWVPEGPFSMTNGQVEGIVNKPVTGALTSVVADPVDPNVMYAGGTNSGLWRTNNAQATTPQWIPLLDEQRSLSVGAIALDLLDTTRNTILVGNGNYSSYGRIGGTRNGLLRSRDGGLTWTTLGSGTLDGKNISGIVSRYPSANFVTTNPAITVSVNVADVFSLANIGIYQSKDFGLTFQQVSGRAGSGLPRGVTYDLVADPQNSLIMYTAVAFSTPDQDGIYKSVDGGTTWARVSNSTIDSLIGGSTSNIEFAVGKQNNVYAAILNAGNLAGLFRSGDGGLTWVQMDTPATNENGTDVGLNPRGTKGPTSGMPEEIAGGQGAIHFSIVADPNDPNIVYVGGDRQPRTFGDTGSFPNSIGAFDFSGRLFKGDASKTAGQQFVHITHSNRLGAAGGGTADSSAPHADSRDMTFDAAGNLVEVDDGGIYRRTRPTSNQGVWQSMIGNIQATEMHDVAYDTITNSLLSGNQDTGTTVQPTSQGIVWNSISTGDGGDVAVDKLALAASGNSIRYTSFQNLGAFRKTVVNAAGTTISTTFPNVAGLTPSFRTPIATNAVEGSRLIIQDSNRVFESLDQGNTLTAIGSFGTTSIEQNAIAYGGKLNGINSPNVLWVGSASDVFVRTTATLARTIADPTSNTVRDLAVDPNQYTRAAVLTASEILLTSNLGDSWTNITGDLSAKAESFRSIVYVPAGSGFLVAGTNRGVFAMAVDQPGVWKAIGANLPNAMVFELEYDSSDDLLVAGTMGRGAWTLDNVTSTLVKAIANRDYGDAPETFKTTFSTGGPSHTATGPTLGALRDFESDGQPSALADGDNKSPTASASDEDGIVFNNGAIPGATWTINVSAPSGGVLNAWVDFNKNGAFDAAERIANERLLTPGTNAVVVTVPDTAVVGQTFGRFRVTSSVGMVTGPTGPASDGEVEDYGVNIIPKAPSINPNVEVINGSFTNTNRSGLATLQLRFDLPVVVDNKTALVLINRTTNQTLNLTNVTLTGNGTAALTWDFARVVVPNGQYTYELQSSRVRSLQNNFVTSTIAGSFHILRGDLSGDAKVDNTDLTVARNYQSLAAGARFRPGDANGDGFVNSTDISEVSRFFNPTGLAPLGIDFGDAKETGTQFPTTLSRNGARNAITTTGPRLGTLVDAEANGQPNDTATGDGADESGVSFGVLRAGAIGSAATTVAATGTVFVNAWIDFNGDGDWSDAGERILTDRPTTAGLFTTTFAIPSTTPGFVFARFRVTTSAGYTFHSFAADGEVEDYRLSIITVVNPPPIPSGNTGGNIANGLGSNGLSGNTTLASTSPGSTSKLAPAVTAAKSTSAQIALAASTFKQLAANGQTKNLDPKVLDQWYKKLGSSFLN